MDDIDFLNFRKVLKFDDLTIFDVIVCFKNKFYNLSYKHQEPEINEIDYKLVKFLCENYIYQIKDSNYCIDINDTNYYSYFFTFNGKAYNYELEEIDDYEILYNLILNKNYVRKNVIDEVRNFVFQNTLPSK